MRSFLMTNFMIPRYNFNAAICESQCKRSDHCHFWRVYQNESMQLPECLHLSTNYHQVSKLSGHLDNEILVSGLYLLCGACRWGHRRLLVH